MGGSGGKEGGGGERRCHVDRNVLPPLKNSTL